MFFVLGQDFEIMLFVDYILSKYDKTQVNEYDRVVKNLFYMTSSFTFISIILMTFENENSVLTSIFKKTK